MISVESRDERKRNIVGFGVKKEMDDTELEEGEACYYHNGDESTIDPDSLSYLDEKIQNVLGHFQKDFEGGVSAENLGSKYGGYGSFLPSYQRSPAIAHQRAPSEAFDSNITQKSPNNLDLEGNSGAAPVSAMNGQVKREVKREDAEEFTKGEAVVKSENRYDQKNLKLRIKVGSDNLPSSKNAKIYCGLGLDVSPSSSSEDNLSDSEGLSRDVQDAPDESPTSILKIVTSFLHGEKLLSPLSDDYLRFTQKEKYSGESVIKPSHKVRVNGNESRKGNQKPKSEKKSKKNEFLESANGNLPKKDTKVDNLACDMKLPLLSNTNSSPSVSAKALNVSKSGNKASVRDRSPYNMVVEESFQNGNMGLSNNTLEDKKANSVDNYLEYPKKQGSSHNGQKPAKSSYKGDVAANCPVSGPMSNGVSNIAAAAPLVKEDWVQCDKCQTWRLLPLGTNPKSLPKKWLCRMLNWLPTMNRCSVSEEETTHALRSLYQVSSAAGLPPPPPPPPPPPQTQSKPVDLGKPPMGASEHLGQSQSRSRSSLSGESKEEKRRSKGQGDDIRASKKLKTEGTLSRPSNSAPLKDSKKRKGDGNQESTRSYTAEENGERKEKKVKSSRSELKEKSVEKMSEERSLDGSDSLKRDRNPASASVAAATSSSSKVSGSWKNRSNSQGGSPVESVSSSPLRANKSTMVNILAAATSTPRKEDEASQNKVVSDTLKDTQEKVSEETRKIEGHTKINAITKQEEQKVVNTDVEKTIKSHSLPPSARYKGPRPPQKENGAHSDETPKQTKKAPSNSTKPSNPPINKVREQEGPPLRKDSSTQFATNTLKEAKDLKHLADRIKQNSGSGSSESTGMYFQAALKFLYGASLLEACTGENSKHNEIQSMQVYGSTAKLCGFCAHEYERLNDKAAAALAYKCMEVAYMRVIYSSHANATRDRTDLQNALQIVPPGESPSSSASDLDNLNNPVLLDKISSLKGLGSPQVANNYGITPQNRPSITRLLSYAQDASNAMEAAKKARITFAGANPKGGEAHSTEAISSVKRALDFNFLDVDGLIRLVRIAMDAITR